MTIWTRFGIASRQSPKHEYQDRAGRVGGEIVTDDGTPMRRLSASERKDAEADGELYVAPTGPHGHLYFVADGIGGAPFGGRTAELVSQRLPEFARAPATWDGLLDVARTINDEAWSWGHDDTGKSKAGCAATLVWFAGDGTATVGQIGDTVAYRFVPRDGWLTRLTPAHAIGNALTRYVGQGPQFRLERVDVPVQDGDLLLLCSDGLGKGLLEPQIEAVLAKAVAEVDFNLNRTAKELVAGAARGGSTDDITVVLVEVVVRA